MPLYEYECPLCGHRFEVLQKMGETGEQLTCPVCGAGEQQRVYSSFASTGTQRSCAPAAPA